MTDHLHGEDIEQQVVHRLVAAGDDRAARDDEARADQETEERGLLLEQLRGHWESSGIAGDFAELASVMGNNWVDSTAYPLAWTRMANSIIEVPRPVSLGARRITCDRTFAPDSNLDIKALHGEALFYRTGAEDGSFRDAGFFCFLFQVQDAEYDMAVPHIAFGEVDVVPWPSRAVKVKTTQHFIGSSEDLSNKLLSGLGYDLDQSHDEKDKILSSVLGKQAIDRLIRKDRVITGVFRQNEQPYVEADSGIVRYNIRSAMQAFLEKNYDPQQTQPHVVERAEQQIELERKLHELSGGMILSGFDVTRAALRQQVDVVEVVEPSDNLLTPYYPVNLRGSMDDGYGGVLATEQSFPLVDTITHALGYAPDEYTVNMIAVEILYGLKGERLREKLMRSELTDDEAALCRQNRRPSISERIWGDEDR